MNLGTALYLLAESIGGRADGVDIYESIACSADNIGNIEWVRIDAPDEYAEKNNVLVVAYREDNAIYTFKVMPGWESFWVTYSCRDGNKPAIDTHFTVANLMEHKAETTC